MHRQRTRLASRVNRVASAVERRGIAATYELHDRLLSNRRSRRRYARESPTLTDVQRQVIEQVGAQGYAVVPFAELFGDEALWRDIEDRGREFVTTTESELEREAQGATAGDLRRTRGKDFLVRRYDVGGVVGLDNPWLSACISRRLLDIANEYLQLWSKLEPTR